MIDRDGTIYQLVSTRIMCRHTVGLNCTAIGIEHVGTSDAQVLGNRAPDGRLAAAHAHAAGPLRDPLRNVIGHNENRSSPFHRERVARLRTQTHARLPEARDGRLPAPARAPAGAGEPALTAAVTPRG